MTSPTSRLLLLLSLMQARRDWSGQQLAERLEVSPRTVRRDVDRLRQMGYRIASTMGPDGGYRLDAGTELPPLLFDDEQVVAVAIALRSATTSGVEISEAAGRALATVRQVLPSRLRHRLDAVEVTALPRSADPTAARVDPEVLVAVSHAARDRTVLVFDYRSPGVAEPRGSRRVEPHHVVMVADRWYLVAWDLGSDDWRVFRVDRIVPRLPTHRRFVPREIPGRDVAAFVLGRFRGSDRSDAWPCRGEVTLLAPAHSIAPFVGDGIAEELDEHRCRVVLGSWSWISLAASIARFDVEIESVRPAALADACAILARRLAQADGSARRRRGDG